MVTKTLAILATLVALTSPVLAQNVVVLGQGPITGNVYVMGGPAPRPAPVPVAKPRPAPVPLVPVYNYVPTPEASNIYSQPGYPTNVPVATSGNCAMYVDPYDLFGQLFGGADLVQSCLVPAY
jgi:hypothetical protein